ncbi:MAG: methyltransferase type 11, partial [Candidatus Hodarchaeota archaeon]
MDLFSRALVEAAVDAFPTPAPIVEIGSCQVEGQEALANLRPLFPHKRYIGCDIRKGRGVDKLMNAESLSFPDAFIGTLICLNVLEHVWDVFSTAQEIVR